VTDAANVQRVLVTGTTSGIGRALLAHYSMRGAHVVAVNRRRVPDLEGRFPHARFECVDVRSREGVARLVEDLETTGQLPTVFVLNAGINRTDNDVAFELDEYRTVVETNLYGVLHFVEPLTRLPVSRVPRHVVAISSLATFVGNPYGVGYHTSKRALSACFDVWSRMYSGTDLVFQQVLLGPVPTEIHTMAGRLPNWMGHIRDAFSGSPDVAAEAIARFAATRKKRLFYPREAVPLYAGAWLCRTLLPGFLSGRRMLDGGTRRIRSAKER
jgi:gluconate 5-dehydrogenase